MRRWPLVLLCVVTLAACAVPRERGDLALDKAAARESEVTAVFDRYREVRNSAIELLDPKPLSTVETGAMLAIDTGSFEVAQRLAQEEQGDTGRAEVVDVGTPHFAKYPLWFYAVVHEPAQDINRVQIFERSSSVAPWLLTASPETLGDTELPDLRHRGGEALTVEADDGAGMAMSPQEAAAAYAAVLADPASPEASRIADDSFIQQMRSAAATNAGLQDVQFDQTWEAEDVRYALRTADGGALAFVTFLRQDTYTVDEGLTVTWPEGSPQQAFLAAGISGSGQLTYSHQVLLYVPGGSEKPRALGQYGGVVSGDAGETATG
ncbi:MAG: hypothetical protein ABWX74_15685 [Aeromicrobium sp.]